MRELVIGVVLTCLATVVANPLAVPRDVRLRDTFSWEVDLVEDHPDLADSQPAHHGPTAEPAHSMPSLTCRFSIRGDGEYYLLGYEARLMSPLGTQIAYAAAGYWKPILTAFIGGEVIENEYGDYVCTVDWYVYGDYIGTGSAQSKVKPKCNNADQQALVDEYYNDTRGVTLKPDCSDVASSGGSDHFTWSQWMEGQTGAHAHGGWGIGKIFTEIETVRTNYLARDEIQIRSGYRCPVHNAEIAPQGAPDSRHMHGKAVDLRPVNLAWDETERNQLAEAAVAASWIEPWSDTKTHLHAQW